MVKLKTDFVTNSSSTAYICYIPNNITADYLLPILDSGKFIDKFIDQDILESNLDDNRFKYDDILEIARRGIVGLFEGEIIHDEYLGINCCYPSSIMSSLMRLVMETGFVCACVDSGGDFHCQIIPVRERCINEIKNRLCNK